MPIANCVINQQLAAGDNNPVELWARKSGVSAELLTINVMRSEAQFGVRYDVMATLQLPTAWSKDQASQIQLGLASALASHFSLPASRVHIVTQWVESGLAVENGEEQVW